MSEQAPYLTLIELAGDYFSPRIVDDMEAVREQQARDRDGSCNEATTVYIPLAQVLATPDLLETCQSLCAIVRRCGYTWTQLTDAESAIAAATKGA